MSKTGTYMIVDGSCVKVCDETPKIASRCDGVYFRQPYMEDFNGKNPVEITSKSHKKAEMKRRGLQEYSEVWGNEEKYEKTKIYSYNGQPLRSRTSKEADTSKIPIHIKREAQRKAHNSIQK